MKPSVHDKRLGKLTLEQYLGLSEGMSYKIAGRMIALACDYTNDVIRLHGEGMTPPQDRESLTHLARAATHAETNLAQLLVVAAQHCAEWQLMDVPQAIRSNMKTASRCRSALCLMAMSAEQHVREERMAA